MVNGEVPLRRSAPLFLLEGELPLRCILKVGEVPLSQKRGAGEVPFHVITNVLVTRLVNSVLYICFKAKVD